MRIIRFSAPEKLGVGTDPLFGVLNDQDAILVLRGDPIYSGIVPAEKSLKLSDVKLLAPLAIVIGRICKEVPASKAKDVIYGYTLANDVTARDLQKKDGQWSRAKGFDTFCPLGPWIETEFIPGDQKITSTLNGEVKQSSMLSEMIFKVPQIIEFVTNVMTLLPGDVILTGTPAGIGPMPSGASITVAIDGLGALTNKVSSRGQ